jgi:hypothetical protein
MAVKLEQPTKGLPLIVVNVAGRLTPVNNLRILVREWRE